jgi:hypothetical protein
MNRHWRHHPFVPAVNTTSEPQIFDFDNYTITKKAQKIESELELKGSVPK